MNQDLDPLYLTFDDGPDPSGTPRVLEALEHADAKATFFVLGAGMRKWPQLLEAIVGAGHRVELHGDAHLDHRYASAQELVHDTALAVSTLVEHGITPQWWRLPWGRPGRSTAPLASGHGLRIAGWDFDTHDWRGDDWAAQPADVVGRVERGGVVLMHDGLGPGATRDGVGNTIDLIEHIAAVAERAGVPLRALPDPGDPAGRRITDQAAVHAGVLAPARSSV